MKAIHYWPEILQLVPQLSYRTCAVIIPKQNLRTCRFKVTLIGSLLAPPSTLLPVSSLYKLGSDRLNHASAVSKLYEYQALPSNEKAPKN